MTNQNEDKKLPPVINAVNEVANLIAQLPEASVNISPNNLRSEKEESRPNPLPKITKLYDPLFEDPRYERCPVCKGYGYIYAGETSPQRCPYCQGKNSCYTIKIDKPTK